MKKVTGKIAEMVGDCPLSLFLLLSMCVILLAFTLTGCKSENDPNSSQKPDTSGAPATDALETDDPNDPSYDNKLRILKSEIERELERINSERVARTEELRVEEEKYNKDEQGMYSLMSLNTLATEFAAEVAKRQTALGVEPDEWGSNPIYALGLRGDMPGYTGISQPGNANTYQNGSWIDCDWLHQDDVYAGYTWESLPVYNEIQEWGYDLLWLCRDADGNIIAMARGSVMEDSSYGSNPTAPDYAGLRWDGLTYSYLGLEHMKLYPDREYNTTYTDTWRQVDWVYDYEPLLHEFE